ncbi:ABC transporter substrate-binding protein [Sinomonas flava]|uniref:ABC transporter substrate-binding protein n=1 Tax=Sinomonas flava TaxID=496857 RepID=A0ABP5NTQ3_9MICC
MSQSIDVGTVLGGRYKVTSSIVSSQEGDLVLDGVDQVLNRPVSILVSGPSNADQLAQSAREVATGERHGAVQVLDLGISHGSTYLITNHTSSADLLDLIVPQDTPYVEPFFTDTLGSEIFGQRRSNEPETYDGSYDPNHRDQYIQYDDYGQDESQRNGAARNGDAPSGTQEPRPSRFPAPSQGSGRASGPGSAASAGAAGAAAAGAASIPPPPPAPPRSAPGQTGGTHPGEEGTAGGAKPKVTPWPARPGSPEEQSSGREAPTAAAPQVRPSSEPATRAQPSHLPSGDAGRAGAAAAGGAAAGAAAGAATRGGKEAGSPDAGQGRPHYPSSRPAASLPPQARGTAASTDYDDEDDEETRPRSVPWLVGGVLAVVLIAALIFAFTTLGGLFQPQQPQQTAGGQPQPTQSQGAPAAPSAPSNAPTTAPAAPPAIDNVTRINPNDLQFALNYDSKLAATFDGNTATYWSDMEFAREDWGGFVRSVALAVELKDKVPVKQVTLSQSGGSGGNLSIYTNDEPSLSGATLAGTTSFTGPQVSVPVANSPSAKYVIIQINSLPRLSAPKTQYNFGLRLTEIKVE